MLIASYGGVIIIETIDLILATLEIIVYQTHNIYKVIFKQKKTFKKELDHSYNIIFYRATQ